MVRIQRGVPITLRTNSSCTFLLIIQTYWEIGSSVIRSRNTCSGFLKFLKPFRESLSRKLCGFTVVP